VSGQVTRSTRVVPGGPWSFWSCFPCSMCCCEGEEEINRTRSPGSWLDDAVKKLWAQAQAVCSLLELPLHPVLLRLEGFYRPAAAAVCRALSSSLSIYPETSPPRPPYTHPYPLSLLAGCSLSFRFARAPLPPSHHCLLRYCTKHCYSSFLPSFPPSRLKPHIHLPFGPTTP
jgi:hypothetical protein